MKRLISISLLIALCLTLASCGGKNNGPTPSGPVTGIYTDGDYTYVLYDGEGGQGFCFHEDEYEGGKYNTPSLVKYSVDGERITVGTDTFTLSELTRLDKVDFPNNLNNGISEGVAHLLSPMLTELRDGYLLESSTRALLITSGDEIVLKDGCLKNAAGTDGLAVIVSPDCDPDKLAVTENLLEGTDNVTFYIPKELLPTFQSHESWSSFKDLMKGY